MIVLGGWFSPSYPHCLYYGTYRRKSLCYKDLCIKHPIVAYPVRFCYNDLMANASNIASKDILARLLAGENLTVNHDAKAHTASFDTRNRVLTLPTWDGMSDSIYDMLIGHEVGHALYTPWTERDEAIKGISAAIDIGGTGASDVAMDYLNVVEDARIERMIQEKFPGLRRDFFNAYKELTDKNFFGVNGTDINTLPLIDRVNLHFKMGTTGYIGLKFTQEEQVFIDRSTSAKSFDEVVAIAKDLFIYCGNEKQDKDPTTEKTAADDSSDDNDGDESSNEEGKSSDKEEKGEGKAKGEDSQSRGEEEDKNTKPTAPSRTMGASKMTHIPAKSVTQQAMKDNITKQYKGTASYSETAVLDTPNIDQIIYPYQSVMADLQSHINSIHKSAYGCASGAEHLAKCSKDLATFLTESAPTINHMVKQFEMRKAADAAKRTSISRSGVLDTVRMTNYKISEDIFRRNAVVQDGKNHGLVMFIDWSSSMSPVMMNTVKQLLQLVVFCKKVGIPFEVYAFSSITSVNKTLPKRINTYGGTDVDDSAMWIKKPIGTAFSAGMNPFSLINFLSSKMKSSEFKASLDMFWLVADAASSYTHSQYIPLGYSLCSTPLDEAIVCAIDIVPKFRANNKVQIVNTIFLTDGTSSGNRIPHSCSSRKGYIIDPKTHKTYAVKDVPTNALLEILRDRTQANVIGFFLQSGKTAPLHYFNVWSKDNSCYSRNDAAANAAETSWKTNGFFVRPNSGYNEEYIIRSDDHVTTTDIHMDSCATGSTATRIKNALVKDACARNKSRVLLGRFINIISK